MRSGRLDRRVTIQTLTTTRDAFGQPIETWAELATVWAQRENAGVVERFQANQRFASAEVVFRIRWYPWAEGIDPKTNRAAFEGRTYNILGTEEIGRKEGLHIVAVARTDLGGEPG